MTLKKLGYSHLIDHYKLAARPLPVVAQADSRVKGRDTRRQGNQDLLVFETKYQPEDNLAGHLQFALKYEGINLEVLGLLFERAGAAEIDAWLDAAPQSAYARRAGFLFEWLTGRQLEPSVTSKARFVPVLDIAQQFGVTDGERNTRFRVINNLPGTRDFCPLVRRTPYLAEMVARNLRERTRETLAHYDQDLLRRAAAFLYLKETQSSFEVEQEKPSATRAQRFADLLRQADTDRPLTEARLIELQHAVIDPRFHEFTWRHTQNWVGTDRGYRQQIDFIPPRPEDLPILMDRLTVNQPRMESPGLININTAPFLVLKCIQGLSEEQIAGILATRDALDSEVKATTAWLVTEDVLSLEKFIEIAPLITARGTQFTIEALGYADFMGMVTRLQVVVEMRGPLVQAVYHRDLTHLGGHYRIREDDLEAIRGQR